MTRHSEVPRPVLLGLAAATCVVLAYSIEVVVGVLPEAASVDFQKFASNSVFAAAAALCAARAVSSRRDRAAWLLVAAALLAWLLGNLYYTVNYWESDEVPFPSLADVGYLAFYPFALAGLSLLIRSQFGRPTGAMLIDGCLGALAVGAVGAAVVFNVVQDTTGGSAATVATNLAYPLGDLLLIGLAVGAIGMGGWALRGPVTGMVIGLAVFAVTDSIYLSETAAGTYSSGVIYDPGWEWAALIIAAAAWFPYRAAPAVLRGAPRSIAIPIAFGLIGLAVLVYDHFVQVDELALALATGSILAVLARLVVTFRQNLRMLERSRKEANVDALTGLANRRRLMRDLERLPWDDEEAKFALVYADLDGFKAYNDLFGHPAGDALLQRLGQRLARAMESQGNVYRVGGDEFCVLVRGESPHIAVVEARIKAALSEHGDGFTVGASCGTAELPGEARTPADALQQADHRMYASKSASRASAAQQSKEVLLSVLKERDDELSHHLNDVADLCARIAAHMQLPDDETVPLLQAAALHDIGKAAIPDAILQKPGPLDDREMEFIRRHTLIGERIIGSAPALSDAAKLVRWSHERVDGDGYPDGLSGDEIPLGARIIAVADSYDAMTSDRSYREAMSKEAAIGELARCAGSQFDADVVRACVAVLDEEEAVEPSAAAEVARELETLGAPR